MGVAQERDFYKLKELTESDLVFLKRLLIEPIVIPELKKSCEEWIDSFQMVFKMKRILDTTFQDQRIALVEKEFDELITNIEEDLHSAIENDMVPILDRLIKKDTSVFDSEESYQSLCYFLAVQYTRTNRVKKALTTSFDSVLPGFMDRAIGVIRHINATTISWGIISKRQSESMNPCLLINETGVRFITSDQPAINTYAVLLDHNDVPSEAEFYYPLSPKLAIIISKRDIYTSNIYELDEDSVKHFNSLMARGSHEQLYGQDRADLLPFVGA